jgi:hypothetical protein
MLDLAPHVALASGPLSGGERSSLVCNANRIGTAPRVPDLLRYEPKSPCLSEHACGHYRETKEPPREELGARKVAAATTGSHHATNQRAKVRAGRVCAAPPAGPTTSISAFSVLRRITKVFDDDKSHVCHPEMADVGPTNRSTFARTHQLRHVAASSDRPAGETASDG